MKKTTTNSMTRLLDDIISYEKQALDLLPLDHPHYNEIKELLVDQINDEIYDYYHTSSVN
jgi:hypothetical protein